MPTEREILDACVCHRVRTAARSVTRAYDDALRPAGLRITQVLVLVAVAAEQGMTITALARLIGMDRTTLTRNLAPLEKDGLIEIGAEGWRRSRTLSITRAGRSKLRESLPYWEKAQQALKRKLGEKTWRALRSDLDDLIQSGTQPI